MPTPKKPSATTTFDGAFLGRDLTVQTFRVVGRRLPIGKLAGEVHLRTAEDAPDTILAFKGSVSLAGSVRGQVTLPEELFGMAGNLAFSGRLSTAGKTRYIEGSTSFAATTKDAAIQPLSGVVMMRERAGDTLIGDDEPLPIPEPGWLTRLKDFKDLKRRILKPGKIK